jgi:hypothetical protein
MAAACFTSHLPATPAYQQADCNSCTCGLWMPYTRNIAPPPPTHWTTAYLPIARLLLSFPFHLSPFVVARPVCLRPTFLPMAAARLTSSLPYMPQLLPLLSETPLNCLPDAASNLPPPASGCASSCSFLSACLLACCYIHLLDMREPYSALSTGFTQRGGGGTRPANRLKI